MGSALEQHRNEDPAYVELKTTQGGVMLLVRLHAGLAAMPRSFLQGLTRIERISNPAVTFGVKTPLSITYSWLERKFGSRTAVRAVKETASELLFAN